jgi:PhzF family phenazine biosynthesis protein
MINALNLHDSGLVDQVKEAVKCKRSNLLLVRFNEIKAVHQFSPNFNDLFHAEQALGTNGLIVTSAGEQPYDFVSRFFAPNMGINEDPVTGAAHTVLTPYWSSILKKKKLHAYQASKRGGSLVVEMKEGKKGQRGRVLISGQAVIVMEAVMRI